MAERADDQYNDMDRVLRRVGLQGTTSEIADTYGCRASSLYPKGSDGNILEHSNLSTKAPLRRRSDDMLRNQATENFDFPLGLTSRLAVQKYEYAVGSYTYTRRVLIKQLLEKDRIVQV